LNSKLLVTMLFLAAANHLYALSISTYNIRNFDYDSRSKTSTNKSKLAEILENLESDLVAVQEITKPKKFKEFINHFLPAYGVALSRCGGANSQSLGFIYNKNQLRLDGFYEDDRTNAYQGMSNKGCPTQGSRPLAVAKFTNLSAKSGLRDFTAIAVHLKAGPSPKSVGKRKKQLLIIREIIDEIREFEDVNIAIMGDFNTTSFNKGGIGLSNFEDFAINSGLNNITYQDVKCSNYYFPNYGSPIVKSSLLDHILISDEMSEYFEYIKSSSTLFCRNLSCSDMDKEKVDVLFDQVSDHCPIISHLK